MRTILNKHLPSIICLTVAAAIVIALTLLSSCTKLDEQVREERIPLPQTEIPADNPDWQPQPDVNK